jgi:hypothetical protein
MAILNRTKNEDKVISVTEGATYKHNDNENRVVAFHVDMGRVVRFSPERMSAEYRMPLGEFLDTYTMVNEEAPKPTENNADGTAKEEPRS